jgi:hypothetical protein
MRTISLNIFLLASMAVTSSLGANLVANPSFQTGDLTSWVSNTQVSDGWQSTTAGAVTGCVGSWCVNVNSFDHSNYLYQDLNTTAGATYNLSFDYAAAGPPSQLRVLWGADIVLDLCNSSEDLTHYTVSNLLADSSTSRLLFLGRQDPGFNILTNVDVEQATAAAPEPAATALILSGIGLVGALRFRRKR